ncbi:carboxymuconolactone decarboxylase family protein [Kitasatospora sp. NBC_00240]|uniref:carboxymuconolactone decarboxylase family protein n=1 Tax=Kitasatospora sp. NBC_00240 TaxID=2903567 RepID=UPI00224D2C22|nr:carboxymuconolactone decarboxylase family protein [Kitasatospora sp. NBC_00240]MCX5211178.1 carboxymuconolactone decarboxylase family protein [Kitasatospora sp. NBC_00240]
MSRMPQLTTDTATGEQRELIEDTRKQLGRVPNLYAAMANGPAALRGYLALRDALVGGSFDTRRREQLALFIAQRNGCTYCVSAHSMRGGKVGMTSDELLLTRQGADADPHMNQVLRITGEIMATGGRVTDEAVAEARRAGVTDAELTEIVAHIALNVLSNYFNHLAEPDLDFPLVDAHVAG